MLTRLIIREWMFTMSVQMVFYKNNEPSYKYNEFTCYSFFSYRLAIYIQTTDEIFSARRSLKTGRRIKENVRPWNTGGYESQ